jgi:hypothetical protein
MMETVCTSQTFTYSETAQRFIPQGCHLCALARSFFHNLYIFFSFHGLDLNIGYSNPSPTVFSANCLYQLLDMKFIQLWFIVLCIHVFYLCRPNNTWKQEIVEKTKSPTSVSKWKDWDTKDVLTVSNIQNSEERTFVSRRNKEGIRKMCLVLNQWLTITATWVELTSSTNNIPHAFMEI